MVGDAKTWEAESAEKAVVSDDRNDRNKAAMLARGPVPTDPATSAGEAVKPPHQRPEQPEFWDHRFRNGVMPWDAGGVPAQLMDFVSRIGGPGMRTLIPGCGSAWEAAHLDRLGWPVCALDFSAAALEQARRILDGYAGQLLCADFFAHAPEAPYELLYERAFLCALPRRLWPDYATQAARLLAPDGVLAGYFFIDPNALRGPPFGIGDDELTDLMSPCFELVERTPATDSIGPFRDREHWMVWRRRG
jgi:thiopurine S-methyltransferase